MKEYFMNEAIIEAKKAYEKKEVPIGAVIVKDNKIISRAHNLREELKDPTAHAEMLAIRDAAKFLGGWRLIDCEMYVTVEPCPMCAGAIMLSRIKRLFIGTMDEKGGAVGSVINIPQDSRYNHLVEVEKNILKQECAEIMSSFFKELRNRKSK